MKKTMRRAGVVAVLGVVGALAGAANAQSTDDNQQAPAVQPRPRPTPNDRWVPWPGGGGLMPSTRPGMPRLDFRKGVPRTAPAPEPVRPVRPAGPFARESNRPGWVLSERGGRSGTNRARWRDPGGVSVSGSYRDDNFWIDASVSSGLADAAFRGWVGADNRLSYSACWPGGACDRSGWNAGSSWGWGDPRLWRRGYCPPAYISYWGYDPAWDRARIGSTSGYFFGADPALDVNYQPGGTAQAAAPVPPPTHEEVAGLAMSVGRYADAVEALKLQLKGSPNDPAVMRRLGIAQLLARTWDDGFARIAKAYEADPVLSDVPLTSEELGVRDDVLRELTGRVVSRARQGRSRDAWMTAAILMQARGKHEQAITMLEAAKNSGMDATLYARMRQSLSR